MGLAAIGHGKEPISLRNRQRVRSMSPTDQKDRRRAGFSLSGQTTGSLCERSPEPRRSESRVVIQGIGTREDRVSLQLEQVSADQGVEDQAACAMRPCEVPRGHVVR